ncbi:3-oxoacyl-[acyl-carrier-protein] synthase II [Amycolatopsis tolypomycina]|uniref:3-oxoacyl-[acyl-carrier-protein] synthase II n=1 Tax=Amycolatopsis tolypomycina TaxID=208445 RepID=A0A1H4SZI9_9PSEU|nr:beta-ketoacyl synthase N-terminal-like domain-containing protein [Amycolatopsis tolypomycina]SEC49625.1 3-oxoacyl-[acyl-carrier-protein] synthase II [Amycolatopsis tolypomycina]
MNPVITAWTAVSPYGIDRESFVDGLRGGRAAPVSDGAVHRTALVPGFDARELLGRKGTRSMDRLIGLAVWAVGRLTADRPAERGDRSGLVLGTMGSLQSTMDFSRSSFTEAKPYFVDAARMPNSIMNSAAGQCAIWHSLTGPNVTLAGGRPAGLSALACALRLLRAGRASNVLVGAVEEYSDTRSWIESHSVADSVGGVLGEGCVVLRVEPAGERPALAEVLAVRSRVALTGDLEGTLTSCVDDALAAAGVSADDVAIEFWSGVPGRADPVADLIGDTGAATAMFHVAGVLATGEPGDVAVVGSADRDGAVVCAVLRLGGPR